MSQLAPAALAPRATHGAADAGLLIVNADDWGRDARTTQCILDCIRRGTVTSTSAMMFMEDSRRGAALAQEHAVDTGLHLNLSDHFTSADCPPDLRDRHRAIVGYLRRNRWAQLVYNPALVSAFDYVVKAQLDEYQRLYGAAPARLDGHHHMHLCSNVLLGGLLPRGTHVRRNFSFRSGE
jgi:predicted glycoside hydrolase/deacetylase ChbG (UPF0249 family)